MIKLTRVLVPKNSLEMNEEGRTARKQYKIFQEDAQNIVLEVPEEEAENVASRLGGLISMNE